MAILLGSLSACTEKGPYIIYGASASRDTTYVAAVETPQNHNVLIEEFTGASCPNCPQGHTVLNGIVASNPGRINSMALHIQGFIQAYPVAGSKYDFRTAAATYIAGHIYPGINTEPSAGIDRLTYGTGMAVERSEWPTDVSGRLAITNKINLYVTSSFNKADTSATIQVKMVYTQADTGNESLTIAIVEDTLYDLQEDGINTDANYLFNNILRCVVPANAFSGNPIVLTTREAGRVVISNYNNIKLTNILDPKHCRVIVFITKSGTSLQVMQSVQTPLVP